MFHQYLLIKIITIFDSNSDIGTHIKEQSLLFFQFKAFDYRSRAVTNRFFFLRKDLLSFLGLDPDVG